MYNLGAKIAELRKKQSLTQSELAELLNVSAQAVSKWEIGASYPDIALLPQIAGLLQCSTDYLLLEDAVPETKYEDLL